jgi:hypothetical protein
MSLPLGIQLATAALAASVPRYILAFLMADGVIFGDWQWIERSMQVVSAIATAVTVTAGCAYVAHVASTAPIHWVKRSALALLWLPLLGFEVGLLSPSLLATMRAAPLACSASQLASTSGTAPALCVLGGGWDALWSASAIAAPAATAAACVLAAALKHTHTTEPAPQSAPQAALCGAPSETPSAVSVESTSHACETCGRSFGSRNALIAHQRAHKASVTTTDGHGHHATP